MRETKKAPRQKFLRSIGNVICKLQKLQNSPFPQAIRNARRAFANLRRISELAKRLVNTFTTPPANLCNTAHTAHATKPYFLQKTVKRAPQIVSNLLARRKTLECSAQKFGRKRAQFGYEIRLMRIRGDNQPIKRFEKIFSRRRKRDTPFQKASRQKEKTLPSKIFSLHSLKRRQRPHASKTFANKKAFPHGKAFWQNPRRTTSGP